MISTPSFSSATRTNPQPVTSGYTSKFARTAHRASFATSSGCLDHADPGMPFMEYAILCNVALENIGSLNTIAGNAPMSVPHDNAVEVIVSAKFPACTAVMHREGTLGVSSLFSTICRKVAYEGTSKIYVSIVQQLHDEGVLAGDNSGREMSGAHITRVATMMSSASLSRETCDRVLGSGSREVTNGRVPGPRCHLLCTCMSRRQRTGPCISLYALTHSEVRGDRAVRR